MFYPKQDYLVIPLRFLIPQLMGSCEHVVQTLRGSHSVHDANSNVRPL
jgi:hypothetical protein